MTKLGETFADEPIAYGETGTLDRDAFCQRVAAVVQAAGANESSTVTALIGDWGSGKTSVLNQVHGQIDDSGRMAVAEFNPWMVSSLEELVAEFLQTVASALPPDGKNRLREEAARYLGRIGGVARVLDLAGTNVGSGMDALADLINPAAGLAERREQLAESLRKSDGRPVLLVLDDLDRLQPDDLTSVFRLVRSVGRLPFVHYLLAFDEGTLIDALTEARVVGNDRGRALSYLDKMIQYRLDLPPMHGTERVKLWSQGIEAFQERYRVKIGDIDRRRLDIAFESSMSTVLTTPRAIKRFFGQLETTWPLLEHEVNVVDFICVTFLRVFAPDLYAQAAASRAELTGGDGPEPLFQDDKVDQDASIERWEVAVVASSPSSTASRKDPHLRLLGLLFPRFAERAGMNTPWFEKTSQQGVDRSHYFDRYFHLGVPEDDIPDEGVRGLLDGLAAETAPDVAVQLQALGSHSPDRLADKVQRLAPTDERTAPAVFALLCNLIPLLYDKPGTEGAMARVLLGGHVGRSLAMISDTDVEALLDVLDDDPVRLTVGADAILRASPQEDEPAASGWLERFKHGLVARLWGVARELARSQVDAESAVVDVLLALSWLGGLESPTVREWVHGRLDDGDCPWKPLDLLAACVATASSNDGTGIVTTLYELPPDRVETLIGLEEALRRTRDQPVPDATLDDLRDSADVSMAARRDFVLVALAAQRQD